MCVCACARVRVCVRPCVRACVCVHMYACMRVCTHCACERVYLCAHAHTWPWVCGWGEVERGGTAPVCLASFPQARTMFFFFGLLLHG